jgi:hypothetical protein
VVFHVTALFDIRLHVEPSIHPDHCYVKLLEQTRIDNHLQLAFRSTPVPQVHFQDTPSRTEVVLYPIGLGDLTLKMPKSAGEQPNQSSG